MSLPLLCQFECFDGHLRFCLSSFVSLFPLLPLQTFVSEHHLPPFSFLTKNRQQSTIQHGSSRAFEEKLNASFYLRRHQRGAENGSSTRQ